MFPKLQGLIEIEQGRKEKLRREARRRTRILEFSGIYLDRGVSANEPDEGPFMMPSWETFEDDPRVQALLTEDDYNVPFTEDRYEQIEDIITEGVVKYNIRTRRDLARIHGLSLVPRGGEEETDENIVKPFLARATTLFRMNWSTNCKFMSYRRLTEILHLALVYSDPQLGGPPKWNTIILGITPDILAGKIARELLRVAGAPENSTWEQMESICGNSLVCTCRKPHFEQPACTVNIVSTFAYALDESLPTPCSQIQHIRDECTWNKPSEAERQTDEGVEDGSFVDFLSLPPIPKS